jgi:SAM-dependent methyltransferase
VNILDLGCGNRKIPGAIGIDKNPRSQADIIHDLDTFPYPFENDFFDEIYGIDVLEHVLDVIRTMEEIHRIGKPGGRVMLSVPHFTSIQAYGDPTHRHFFTSQSLDYFCGGFPEYEFYSQARFKKIKVRLNFWKIHRWNGISFLANRFPLHYEKLFGFIFPAMNLQFELKIVKERP